MFKLNRLTDYAVVALAHMVRGGARVQTAPQIARECGVPLPTISKILAALGQAGIVQAQRGAAGGYTLARPAAAISMADVIEALEGPIALTACVEGTEEHCVVETLCPMRGNWNRVNRAIRTALDGVTLAEMASVDGWAMDFNQDRTRAVARLPVGE